MAQDALFPLDPVAEGPEVVTAEVLLAAAAGFCGWPDGGCGAPILRIRSATTGKTMALDAAPLQRVVVGEPIVGEGVAGHPLIVGHDPDQMVPELAARVLKTYEAHQANCAPYLAMQARLREQRKDRP